MHTHTLSHTLTREPSVSLSCHCPMPGRIHFTSFNHTVPAFLQCCLPAPPHVSHPGPAHTSVKPSSLVKCFIYFFLTIWLHRLWSLPLCFPAVSGAGFSVKIPLQGQPRPSGSSCRCWCVPTFPAPRPRDVRCGSTLATLQVQLAPGPSAGSPPDHPHCPSQPFPSAVSFSD